MGLNLYTPAKVIEERGADYFVAPHPEPRSTIPNIIEILLGARYSLVGDWMAENYCSGLDTHKILGRNLVIVNTPELIK